MEVELVGIPLSPFAAAVWPTAMVLVAFVIAVAISAALPQKPVPSEHA
jgi:hypothetical protein